MRFAPELLCDLTRILHFLHARSFIENENYERSLFEYRLASDYYKKGDFKNKIDQIQHEMEKVINLKQQKIATINHTDKPPAIIKQYSLEIDGVDSKNQFETNNKPHLNRSHKQHSENPKVVIENSKSDRGTNSAKRDKKLIITSIVLLIILFCGISIFLLSKIIVPKITSQISTDTTEALFPQFSPGKQYSTIASGNGIACFDVSEDGNFVAFHSGGEISIFNTINGLRPNTITDLYSYTTSNCQSILLSFSPDGTLIAAASEDSVRIWNVESGMLVNKIKIATELWERYNKQIELTEILQITFSPDNQYLVVVFTHFVELYKIDDSSLFTTIEHGSHDNDNNLYRSAMFSPNGDYLLIGVSGGIFNYLVFDFPYLKSDYWKIDNTSDINFAPDRKTVVYLQDNFINLYGDMQYYDTLNRPDSSFDRISAVNFSNNSKEIIFADQVADHKWEIIQWNIENGEHNSLYVSSALPRNTNCKFSQNLKTIVCSDTHELYVWNADNRNDFNSIEPEMEATNTPIPIYSIPPSTPEQQVVDNDLYAEYLDKMMVRNIRYNTVSNDGTQAVVQVLMEKLVNGIWTEMSANVVLRMVEGKWQSDSKTLTFSITENGNATILATRQAAQATQDARVSNSQQSATDQFLSQLGGTLVYVQDRKVYVRKPDGSLNIIEPLNNATNGIFTDVAYFDYYDISISPDGLGFYFLGFLGNSATGLYYSNLDGTEVNLITQTNYDVYKTDFLVSPDGSKIIIADPDHNPMESGYKIFFRDGRYIDPHIDLGNGVMGTHHSFGMAWAPDSTNIYQLVTNRHADEKFDIIQDKMQIVIISADAFTKDENTRDIVDPNRSIIFEGLLQEFLDQLGEFSPSGPDIYPYFGLLSPNGHDLLFENLKLLDIATGTLMQLNSPSCGWIKWDTSGTGLYLLDSTYNMIYHYDIATGIRTDMYTMEVPTVWDCYEGRMDWLPN